MINDVLTSDTEFDTHEKPEIYTKELCDTINNKLAVLGFYPEHFSVINKNGYLALFDGESGYKVESGFLTRLQNFKFDSGAPIESNAYYLYDLIGLPNFARVNSELNDLWNPTLMYQLDESGVLLYKTIEEVEYKPLLTTPGSYAYAYFQDKVNQQLR